MTKKIALWTFATLLIAGVAMGAYMYSNSENCDKTAAGSCPFQGSTMSKAAAFSYTTLSTSSGCSGQKAKTEQSGASAYTAVTNSHQSCPFLQAKGATLASEQACPVKMTSACNAQSDAKSAETVALSTK